MKNTIDNPKEVFVYRLPQEDNFTGVVKDTQGNIAYYCNSELHREDGPAVIRRNGNKEYFIKGAKLDLSFDHELKEYLDLRSIDNLMIVSNYDSPENNFTGVTINESETITYYVNGTIHRDNGPARLFKDGRIIYFQNGFIHREDGPAEVYLDGSYAYSKNGNYHRDDGPAVVNSEEIQYWKYGNLHREDGPALINRDVKEYYIEGHELSDIKYDEELARYLKLSVFK